MTRGWRQGAGDTGGEEWFVYIIECRTGVLYVGIARDIGKRVEEHNKGRACRYTRFRRPVRLMYTERCGDYASARRRESQVKKYSRKKKTALCVGKDFSLGSKSS